MRGATLYPPWAVVVTIMFGTTHTHTHASRFASVRVCTHVLRCRPDAAVAGSPGLSGPDESGELAAR